MKLSFVSIAVLSSELFKTAVGQVRVSTDGAESAIVVADLDNDGINDVLIGACTSTGGEESDIALFRGSTGGLFELPDSIYQARANGQCVSHFGSKHLNSLAVGDLTGDGSMDIVAAADWLPHGGPTLFALYNLGGLKFDQYLMLHENKEVQSTSFTLNSGQHRANDVKLADIDGDGDLDVLATLFDLDNGLLMYYENDGSGIFQEQILFEDLRGRGSIAVGDMDGDNDLDIVLLSKERGVLWLLENQLTSGGGFVESVLDSSTPASHTVAIGDLTGDGQLDIVTGGLNAVEVYQNQGNKVFENAVSFASGTGNYCQVDICFFYESLAIQDLDGDGLVDILATNGRNVVWFPQTSPLQIGREQAFISTSGGANVMAVGDLDNDGLNDVVVGDSYNVDAYLGRITGATAPTPSPLALQPTVATPPSPSRSAITYDPSNSVLVSTEGTTSGLLVDDIDGDGLNDIIVGHCTPTSVDNSDIVIYQGEEGGSFSPPGSVYQGGNGGCADCCSDFRAIVSGDMDGDGLSDLIAAADYLPHDGPTLFILLNNGGMNFTQISLLDADTEPIQAGSFSLSPRFHRASSVKVADLNGDGAFDLLATLHDLDNGILMYYENDGSGRNFNQQILSEGLLGRGVIELGDLDGDDDLDILLLSQSREVLWILENQLSSGGGFVESVADSSAKQTRSIAVADLTGNGQLDVVTGGGGVALYQNTGDLTLQKVATMTTLFDYNYLAIQEVDGFGNIDIIGAGASNVLWIPLVAPLVPLDQLTLIERAGSAHVMAIGDLNGDDVNDIVVSDFNTIDVYFGTIAPTSTATNPPVIPTPAPTTPTSTTTTPAPFAFNPDPTTVPPVTFQPTTVPPVTVKPTTTPPTQGPEPTEVAAPETATTNSLPTVQETVGATVSDPSETSDATFRGLGTSIYAASVGIVVMLAL